MLSPSLSHLVAFAAYPYQGETIPFLPQNSRRVTVRIVESWLRSPQQQPEDLVLNIFGAEQLGVIQESPLWPDR